MSRATPTGRAPRPPLVWQMLDPLWSVRTASRMVKARAPRFAYASVFAVALGSPIADDFAAFPTYPAVAKASTRRPLSERRWGRAIARRKSHRLGVDRAAPLARTVEVSASVRRPARIRFHRRSRARPCHQRCQSARCRYRRARCRQRRPPPPSWRKLKPLSRHVDLLRARGHSGSGRPYTDCSGGSDVGTAIRSYGPLPDVSARSRLHAVREDHAVARRRYRVRVRAALHGLRGHNAIELRATRTSARAAVAPDEPQPERVRARARRPGR